jgi:polyisoprenoid-binding protein YceI
MRHFARSLVALIAVVSFVAPAALAADNYKVDPVHSSLIFRSKHAGIGIVYGRFNAIAGQFALDEADPSKSSFNFEAQSASVDTGQEKRDAHLKSPDFLNAKQYPTITFKSTAVKKGAQANVWDVSGDLSFHGVTKSVTVPVELIGKGEFPPKTPRVGVESVFAIKMSDFDVKGIPGAPGVIGDEVRLMFATEGTKQ